MELDRVPDYRRPWRRFALAAGSLVLLGATSILVWNNIEWTMPIDQARAILGRGGTPDEVRAALASVYLEEVSLDELLQQQAAGSGPNAEQARIFLGHLRARPR